ncbi:unnamed protein product [Mytilus coruscus]|uniref:Fibronectin type-III domain-containing protein n=1 Tax=Mytilus coruscus TaxID=42192 RepID=A0A6J8DFL9_MYTCO|nr:unnamed protein product [Mytilus coruscus]
MSSPESKELMKLFKCSTDVATQVVCAFADSKLLHSYGGNFQKYLEDNKHFFYHQWEQKNTACCYCPPAGCTVRRMSRMDNWIFNSFYNDNGITDRKHILKRGGTIQQRCLHKYKTRNIRLDNLDITILCFVLLNSGKLNGPETIAVETINIKRNSICHAWSTHCFSMVQLNDIWTEIESAVSTLTNPYMMPIVKSLIQSSRKYDFDKEEIASLSTKLDKLNASLEELSGRIPTNNNNINTTIANMEVRLTQIVQQSSEDIKQSQQALSQKMEKLESFQECPVLWQLTTPKGWDLEEVVAKLKDAAVQDEVVKIKYVKKGSLIIMTTVAASTLNDQEAFETAVKNFLNKIVEVCHINTKVHAQVDVRLHILNPDEVKLSFDVPTTRVPSENKFVQTYMTKTDIEKPQCESCEKRGKPTIVQYFCHDCKERYCETNTKKQQNVMQVRLRNDKQHQHLLKTEKPDKPYVTKAVNESDHIILKWKHNVKLGVDEFYQILMKQHPDGKWKIFQTPNPCIYRFVTIDGLKAETSYIFKVRKANDTTGEDGPFSPESDIIVTGESPAFKIMKRSEKIEDGIPAIYRLPIQEIPQARNEGSQTRKFILGTPGYNTKEKTIMIVGATGSGKSTLINGMANYAMGVTWEDSFRFTLIHLETCEKERVGNEALSQTEWITCYSICSDVARRIKYTINFIDTPGFGDTRGLQQDAKIVSQIRDLFTAKDAKGVLTLDAVCFILKAPDAKLTTSQKYIFESILALFGNDIKNNIFTLVTFADGQKPPVLAALEALDGKPLPSETYFPFNNSALFVDNRADHQGSLSAIFWKMGMKSCSDFFQSLDALQTTSLLLTSEVLVKRQKLENTILHLQEEIDLGLSKINLLEQEVNIFIKYKSQIRDNENFEYEVEESKMEKVDISGKGIHTTTCLTCNFTCHDSCAFANDSEKTNCCAMDYGGNCTVCPKNCNWKLHSNLPFVFKWYKQKVVKTYSAMKDRYQQAHQKKVSQKEILEELQGGIKVLEIGIQIKIEEITEYGNRLKEINLRPDPLSTVQYIELMIESEMREKKSGFNQRVETLEQCKKRAEIGEICQIFENQLRDTRATVKESTAADDSMSSDKDERGMFKKAKDKFTKLIYFV